ncbi:MAG: protein kinase [Verrucomicrobia bacterium]|nr:protein kinase [Verrucomicrobiota bacterium]
MKPDPSEQSIFAEALALEDPQLRVAFLDQACLGHPALRARVENLLRATERAGRFLEDGPTTPGLDALPLGDLTGTPGERIGRYKLLEVIGEGGCGVVYMAEQEEPVRRRVALKIIKPGMDSRSVVARFEAERQALAMMDHPNIARILDGGTTPQGRPYFVMELVRGIRITDYCDQARLTTTERLRLFVPVCQAVQHAHQKGIIHRDLKPSNILVTINDGIPVPKVIDFGIAKATAQRLTDKTLFTQFHAFIGTPAYTSPEQAALSSVDVDTRSDIYSLGVLLYELLTGRPPFDGQELLRSGLDELRRILREVEPPRPSTRLETLDLQTATEMSRRRQATFEDLTGRIRGDLDWIVMKCLEKDRNRRYETANGLALDIQRHLGSEPVAARPPSAGYKLQKWVRRHRWGVAAGSAVALAVVIGLTVSLWQAARARRALNELRATAPAFAEQARVLTEQERFDEAVEKLDYAARLRPDETRYPLAKGDLLLAQLKLSEAQAQFEKLLQKDPGNSRAQQQLQLCSELLSAPTGTNGALSRDSLLRLRRALDQDQRSTAELMPVSRLLGQEDALLRDYWLTRLRDLPTGPERPLAERLTQTPSGRLALDLSGARVTSLSSLTGMPLGELRLTDCTEVRDLGPLRQSPLQVLHLGQTQVRDLSPLRSLTNLHTLFLQGTPVSELKALQGLPLVRLRLDQCSGITDLDPLRGMPLEELNLRGTQVSDLSVIGSLPLRSLDLTQIPARDFSALSGRPLQTLSLQGTRFSDLSLLRGMPLRKLLLNGCDEAKNYAVLSDLTDLEILLLPVSFRSLPESEQAAINRLRTHPKLRQIGVEIMSGMLVQTAQPSEAFWRDREIEERIAAPLRAQGLYGFTLVKFPKGTYSLSLNGQPIRDLSFLPTNAPIVHLSLPQTQVSDLTPVRHLPLERLDLTDTPVTNLSPLVNLPLEQLFIAGTPVSDVSPLRHLPLRTLFFSGTAVTDVSPLASVTNLEEVLLPRSATNVTVLRSLPRLNRISFLWHPVTARAAESAEEFWQFQASQTELFQTLQSQGIQFSAGAARSGGWHLEIHDPAFTNTALLRGLPLRVLSLDESSVADLSPLRDSNIEILDARGTRLTHLEAFRNSPLGASVRELRVSRTALIDLTPLESCSKLELLDIGTTQVADLSPLRRLSVQRLYLTGSPVTELAAIMTLPLRTLYVDGCAHLTSVAPVSSLILLEELMLPEGAADIGRLRTLPRLDRISFRWKAGVGPEQTAAEFWRSWSATTP